MADDIELSELNDPGGVKPDPKVISRERARNALEIEISEQSRGPLALPVIYTNEDGTEWDAPADAVEWSVFFPGLGRLPTVAEAMDLKRAASHEDSVTPLLIAIARNLTGTDAEIRAAFNDICKRAEIK